MKVELKDNKESPIPNGCHAGITVFFLFSLSFFDFEKRKGTENEENVRNEKQKRKQKRNETRTKRKTFLHAVEQLWYFHGPEFTQELQNAFCQATSWTAHANVLPTKYFKSLNYHKGRNCHAIL